MLVTEAPPPTSRRRDRDHNHNQPPKGHLGQVGGSKYLTEGQMNLTFDAGYSSERSPDEDEDEDEEDPRSTAYEELRESPSEATPSPGSLHGPPSIRQLIHLCPFINEATLFEVTVIKNSRGLGLAVTGGIECETSWPGLVRIKKLYPQTPASMCGQLLPGDILLEANNAILTGLTSHEALEVLRVSASEVRLQVCRPPEGSLGEFAKDADLHVVSNSILSNALSSQNQLAVVSQSYSSCGEFEVQLTKVAGSLGFTLRKQDDSILGHTVRSLVKEPAISDGRIRSGDKILSVNGIDMRSLTHEEAISLLRTCPDSVCLRMYRDDMQTPISPASPTEPDVLGKPKPLRKEAMDMLSDIALRKHSSPSSSTALKALNDTPNGTRRRRLQKTPSPDLRKTAADRWDSLVRKTESFKSDSPDKGSRGESSNGDVSPSSSACSSLNNRTLSRDDSVSSSNTNSLSDSSKPKRPNFLDLSSRHNCPRKSQFTPPHEIEGSFPSSTEQFNSLDSAPQLSSTRSDTPALTHSLHGYQSINLGTLHAHENAKLCNTSSDHNLRGHVLSKGSEKTGGLLKWKGVVFTPEEEDNDGFEETPDETDAQKPKVVTLELNRGWNSRLGFSLQSQNDKTVVVAIYADSVAAKDGRLRIGDQILKVNGEDITSMKAESVIDYLRKTRGKIALTVLQQPF